MMQGQLKIHSENILPIIKKWLYSEKDIFVRELVSNACDAIQKVKILQDLGEIKNSQTPRIEVKIDKQAKTLTFSDTGIGMNADEVEKYLAQIAFSGAEEFVKAYEAKDAFIGHFGLGFYSAYMVADKVEVHTLSCRDGAEAVLWRCDGSSSYELEKGSRTTPGTDITLFVGSENTEYLEESHLLETLTRYCAFLPHPIYCNDTCINSTEPLWMKRPADCTKADYLSFFRTLYPFEGEPLFWVHLNVDYPFNVKGILYFPQMGKNFDSQKSQVKLFCNRVFVSDDCKDILPEFLSMLRGTIDSPDIPLNVSRSYLQVDKTVRSLSNHISKKIADSLAALHKQDEPRFFEILKEIEFILKLGILQDEKFYSKAKDILFWKTTKGEHITVESYLEKHRQQLGETLFYTTTDQFNQELIKLYEEKGIDILVSSGPIDAPLFAFLEKELKTCRFKRIDAEVGGHLLDADKEKTVLDAHGRTEAAKIADFVRAAISADKHIEVSAKSLASDQVTGFVSIGEEERRLRDYLVRVSNGPIDQSFKKINFVVNTNSALVQNVYQLSHNDPFMAQELMREVYDLTLLSQNEMSSKEMQEFVTRSNTLIGKLAQKLNKN